MKIPISTKLAKLGVVSITRKRGTRLSKKRMAKAGPILRISTFVLLLFGIAATPHLPVPLLLPVLPKPAPNTNSYGCHLQWDAVAFADQYLVFLGDDPNRLQPVTNVTGTDAIFRIWQTNSRPWVGVRAVAANQLSDMTVLTLTNYLVGRVEDMSGRPVPGTAFVMETGTNAGRFLLVRGTLSNNWPRLP